MSNDKLCIQAFAASLLLIGSGCASLPDATVHYYLAESQIRIKAVRTVSCTSTDHPIVVTDVSPTVSHAANRSESETLPLALLKSYFADADLKVELYDDGRLKSINGSAAGQGEQVVKALIALAKASGAASQPQIRPQAFPTECGFIKKIAGDKPLSLVYESSIHTGTGIQDIEAAPSSRGYETQLRPALGGICALIGEKTRNKPIVAQVNARTIKVRQPALVEVSVFADAPPMECGKGRAVWTGYLPVSQEGETFRFPIPKPPLFGKQTFGASFEPSGAITLIQFGTTSGTPGALGALTAAIPPKSDPIADIKAEADLIAAQQRLIVCQTTPKDCK